MVLLSLVVSTYWAVLEQKKDDTSCSLLFCDPVGIRTQDPQLRRLLLYPTELPDQKPLGGPPKGVLESQKAPQR